MILGLTDGSPQQRVPQTAQDQKTSVLPLRRGDVHDRVSPSTQRKASTGTATEIPKALPVRRWQSVQWQQKTALGCAVHSYRNCPQSQPPRNGTSKPMPFFVTPVSICSGMPYLKTTAEPNLEANDSSSDRALMKRPDKSRPLLESEHLYACGIIVDIDIQEPQGRRGRYGFCFRVRTATT